MDLYLRSNEIICFCNTADCNDHCEYKKDNCRPIELSPEINGQKMVRCDAKQLCGTKSDGKPMNATTEVAGNGTKSFTGESRETTEADGTGGSESITTSLTLVEIQTFIFLVDKLFKREFCKKKLFKILIEN